MAFVSFHWLLNVHDINFLRFKHIAYSPQDGRAFARIAFGGVAPSFVFWLSLLEEEGEGESGLKGLVCPPPLSLSLSLYAQPPPPGPKRTFHSFSADSLHGSLGTMAALSPSTSFPLDSPSLRSSLASRSVPPSVRGRRSDKLRSTLRLLLSSALSPHKTFQLPVRQTRKGWHFYPTVNFLLLFPRFSLPFQTTGASSYASLLSWTCKAAFLSSPPSFNLDDSFFMLCCFLIDWRKIGKLPVAKYSASTCWNDLQAKCGRLNWSGGNEKPILRIIFCAYLNTFSLHYSSGKNCRHLGVVPASPVQHGRRRRRRVHGTGGYLGATFLQFNFSSFP